MKVRYCPKGHDTLLVGRTTWGYCAACNRERNRAYYRKNSTRLLSKRQYYKVTTAGILSQMRHNSRRRMEGNSAAEV